MEGYSVLELYVKNPMDIDLRSIDELPAPKDDEVKIKIAYGGICGSDIGVFKGKLAHAAYPLTPGHELVGTVIEAGSNAKYSGGTRVVVMPNTFCGECDFCLKGQTNICRHKKSLGVNMNGGFSEKFILSSKYVLAVPDDLPDEKAVLIEPFSVVVHAFKKVQITKGSSVAIVGSGNEGMLAAALASYLGANVTAVDINPKKHDMIRRIGDIRAVYPQDLKDETFDVVFEAAGSKNSVEQGIQLVKPGGAMVFIGLAPEVNLPVTHVVRSEITLYGSIIYNFPDDYLQAIEYLKDPKLNVEPIVSMVVPFTDYIHAYESALSGDFGKIVFDFNRKQDL